MDCIRNAALLAGNRLLLVEDREAMPTQLALVSGGTEASRPSDTEI
jgi:hypothetical protein